jgi:hypothetical protein
MTASQTPPLAENGGSAPASSSPEQTIRRYLDGHSGETDASLDQLLNSFGVEEADADGRGRITTALSGAGVGTDRGLPFLGADEMIHLFVAGSNGIDTAPPAEQVQAPPPPVRRFQRQQPLAPSEPSNGGQPPRQPEGGPGRAWYKGWPVIVIGLVGVLAIIAAVVLLSSKKSTAAPKAATLTIQTKSFTTSTKRLGTISGTVSPADATVEVAGVTTNANQGFWTARVPLDYGQNRVEVRATKRGYQGASAATVLVRRHGKKATPPPPAVVVVPPATPAAPSPATAGPTTCGGGLSAGPNTSCPFAELVRASYPGSSNSFEVYSPVTDEVYTMSCTTSSPHTCTGGNNASVYFP